MNEERKETGNTMKITLTALYSVPRDEYLSYVPFDVFPFRDASFFAWWKFTGNLFITAIPILSIDAKFLSINSSLEERSSQGGKPVFEEKFPRRNSFWERLFNAHPEEEKLFHDGIVSILDFSYCFDVFFSLSLPREKRRNESIETNLFEKI